MSQDNIEEKPSKSRKGIHLSSSPHFSFTVNTRMIMATVLFALLPEVIYGIVLFKAKAFFVILTSVISCLVFEALFQILTKQKVTVGNLSACVTGVMLALVCPPTVPLWMVVLGALVAIVIAKGLFGGIGSNVFNPALTGRAFMFISFASAMGSGWVNPGVDAVSTATILSHSSSFTDSSQYLQYFLGNRAGCIGETSILLICISFLILLITHVIDWRAPLAMVGTVFVLTFFAGFISSQDALSGLKEAVFALLTGGLMFGATFMITDYSTAPVTKPGRLIFGAGAGLITFLIRRFGGYPEGVMFSILIMNAIAPFLNNITVRKYGYGRKGHRKPAARKIVQNFDVKNGRIISEEKTSDSKAMEEKK